MTDKETLLTNIIAGHSVFTVSRKYDETTIHATLYKRGEAKDGTFIRLSVSLEDFGRMVEQEMATGKPIQDALATILGEVKAASKELIK